MKDTGELASYCESKCEKEAESCLDDITDLGSCQIKYNRCRIKCAS